MDSQGWEHDASQRKESGRSKRTFAWLGRVVRRMGTDTGDAMSSNGDAAASKSGREDAKERDTGLVKGHKVGLPSVTFGDAGMKPNNGGLGPIPGTEQDRPLVRAAMAVDDPWAGDVPPLFSEPPAHK